MASQNDTPSEACTELEMLHISRVAMINCSFAAGWIKILDRFSKERILHVQAYVSLHCYRICVCKLMGKQKKKKEVS